MTKEVVIVTGASKGIGFETVLAALNNDMIVVGTSRTPEKLAAKVQEKLPAKVDNFTATKMDFNEESIKQVVSEVIAKFGRIDVLVNNAGYAILGAFKDMDMAEVRTNFDVNVFGLMSMTQAVLPQMRKQKSGRIINLSSISGSVTGPSQSIYSASKAAVTLMSEALAQEVAPYNIKVTALCPWGVRTDFLDESSLKKPATQGGDYKVVDQTLAGLARLNHNQNGDPALVAQAIMKVVDMPNPPARLYLGAGALMAVQSKIEEIVQVANENLELSQSIDSPAN